MKWTGFVAAPFTPMHADGSVAYNVVHLQAQRLCEDGVSGAFVCGTTGEGLSLTIDERKKLTEEWVSAKAGKLRIITHVGHQSQAEACVLASHAARVGVDAVSVIAPTFFKPATVADLVAWCVPIASAAKDTPFYFYHLPGMTGVALSMTEFFSLAVDAIPNFAGLKYTHNDLMEFQQLLAMAGDTRDVLFGRDEILLAALAVGARGAIGSTYNYAAPLYARLLDCFEKGNLPEARQWQARTHRLVELLRTYGELATGKGIMTLLGVPVGSPRPPLGRLSPQSFDALARKLTELDCLGRPIVR